MSFAPILLVTRSKCVPETIIRTVVRIIVLVFFSLEKRDSQVPQSQINGYFFQVKRDMIGMTIFLLFWNKKILFRLRTIDSTIIFGLNWKEKWIHLSEWNILHKFMQVGRLQPTLLSSLHFINKYSYFPLVVHSFLFSISSSHKNVFSLPVFSILSYIFHSILSSFSSFIKHVSFYTGYRGELILCEDKWSDFIMHHRNEKLFWNSENIFWIIPARHSHHLISEKYAIPVKNFN